MTIDRLIGVLDELKDKPSCVLHSMYLEKIGPISSRTHRRVLLVALAYHAQIEHATAKGETVNEIVKQRHEMALKARTFEDLKEMGLVMPQEKKWVGVVESTCPAFKRGWNDQVVECQDCQRVYGEEYEACKTACQQKAEAKIEKALNPPAPKAPKPVVASQPTAAPGSPIEFKGFRKGTQACITLDMLEAHAGEWVAYATITQQICDTLHTDPKNTRFNVVGYIGEWVKGRWNCAPVKFPFRIEKAIDSARLLPQ